jgi:hypothetical protein
MDSPKTKFGPVFANRLIPPLVEKGFLSGEFVRQAKVFAEGFAMFGVGAVLGRRYRNNLTELLSVFSMPNFISPEERQKFATELGSVLPHAQRLLEVYVMHHMHRSEPSKPLAQWREWLAVAGKGKTPPSSAIALVYLDGERGITLGSHFPDVVPDLWNRDQASQLEDPVVWAAAYKHGAVTTSQPVAVSFDEQERLCVGDLVAFCADAHPDMVDTFRFAS